jgi:hypothetical protein
MEAGLMSAENKWVSKGVGLIDAVLLCLARKNHMKIWTFDKKLLTVMNATEKFTPVV